ncbi:hypothetical protein BV898_10788 [Hypsibius exemplaris]|uniref:Uncharacterized protein n=1 Tax=Hypsibius exemplaris TaxID=2072580 RepID=A0A1W0WIM2_HYPEX|nr:hypothetical protein BV898_10788 [Hypsibius exemplaris]
MVVTYVQRSMLRLLAANFVMVLLVDAKETQVTAGEWGALSPNSNQPDYNNIKSRLRGHSQKPETSQQFERREQEIGHRQGRKLSTVGTFLPFATDIPDAVTRNSRTPRYLSSTRQPRFAAGGDLPFATDIPETMFKSTSRVPPRRVYTRAHERARTPRLRFTAASYRPRYTKASQQFFSTVGSFDCVRLARPPQSGQSRSGTSVDLSYKIGTSMSPPLYPYTIHVAKLCPASMSFQMKDPTVRLPAPT